MEKNKFIIVLVNFNSHFDTIECLESIYKSTFTSFNVVVVDNSLGDESINTIVSWAKKTKKFDIDTKYKEIIYPLIENPIDFDYFNEIEFEKKQIEKKLTIVKATENNGFAAANNIVLKNIQKNCTDDTIIWLLNNDTIIKEDVIFKIHNLLEINNNLTLFGTPLIDYESRKIQAIGGRLNKFTGNSKIIGNDIPIKEYKNLIIEKIDYPNGASMIIYKKFLDVVGFLNEDYFLYFEELDWAYRSKNKFKTNVQILDVLGVYHKQGKSTSSKNYTKQPESTIMIYLRSKIIFSKKFLNLYFISIFFYTIFISIPKYGFQYGFHTTKKIIKFLF